MATTKTRQAQILNNEAFKRQLMNCWRRDQEYNAVMEMSPEKRSALLFQGVCSLAYAEKKRRENAEKRAAN